MEELFNGDEKCLVRVYSGTEEERRGRTLEAATPKCYH